MNLETCESLWRFCPLAAIIPFADGGLAGHVEMPIGSGSAVMQQEWPSKLGYDDACDDWRLCHGGIL
ncbi:MAG: hypothetical protein KBI32_11345, partial [Phycisphaerae bacterium]|nr:hypothetical protein [Phycisphaerae bacterium]